MIVDYDVFCPPNTLLHSYKGTPFDPIKLELDDITVEEIAHAGARISRFGGHYDFGDYIYSVAQHSVSVAHLCHPCEKLEGLWHESGEMLGMNDMIRPIKYLEGMKAYRDHEDRVQEAFNKKLGLKPMSSGVKWADDMVLVNELRVFQHQRYPAAKNALLMQALTEIEIVIEPKSISKVVQEFLELHYKLVKIRKGNYELDEESGYPGVR